MANFNLTVTVGNFCRDPEIKYAPSGTAICEFTLACNRTWYDKIANQKREECDFIEITAFGKTAENIAKYHKKGDSILIHGRLKQDTWDDKETGKKRSKLRVICENMTMLGGKGGNSSSQESSEPASNPIAGDFNENDVPF